MEIPIGLRIKKEVIRQGMPLGKFADKIHVSRTDVYHIFGRKAINSELLKLICIALNHNFFDDLADDIRDRLGDATPKEMLTKEGMLSILRRGDDHELVYYDDDNQEYKLKERLCINLCVNGVYYEETIGLPDFMFPWLLNSFARAIAGPMKGLDKDAFNQQFYPWLERQCPRQARCIKKAVGKRLLQRGAELDNKIEYLLDGLPERIIVTKEYKK
ncbi:MAG: helix-turn-helix transcriptional regulator [Bacteroidaceae bacterium]|jgi:hypothetical protein|nr:helix-turn-helix transcriptional regulator [Bacteroidaceae bacterium]